MTKGGTQCSRLGDKMGIRHRLDSVVWDVFSILSDSGISGTLLACCRRSKG